MLNTKFPDIKHIDDVKPYLVGKDEFFIAERETYDVINYMVAYNDSFNHPMLAECRGLIFDKSGKLISRPLHKFFNLGEKEFTQFQNVDFTKPHVILEKLDGSMIRPIPLGDGKFRLGTKMGITDVALQAEEWIADKPNYVEFITDLLDWGFTPIFEWCSRKQRIVIDYPEDRLVLIAIRDNLSGWYHNYNLLITEAKSHNIDVVKTYPGTAASMEQLVSDIRSLENEEGYIIRFDDGHMIKVKADQYVAIHKAVSNVTSEKNIIQYIMNDTLDDVKPFLHADLLNDVEEYEKIVMNGLMNAANVVSLVIHDLQENPQTRKEFALNQGGNKQYKVVDPILKGIIFKFWFDNGVVLTKEDALSVLRKKVLETDVDKTRYLWNNVKWTKEGME